MIDTVALKELEARFPLHYPQGFSDPEMEKIGKKHRMDKMVDLAREAFSPSACLSVDATAKNMVKVVSGSSMVSMFEKPKFRDFVEHLSTDERAFFVNALAEYLHGDQQGGFEAMVEILKTGKLAKWSLMTIIPAYYAPRDEVFVKPTTAKDTLKYLGIEDLVYKPTPTWDFYRGYRAMISQAKALVSESLSPSNAAFSGFLMMAFKL
jgi:hypothetical protein